MKKIILLLITILSFSRFSANAQILEDYCLTNTNAIASHFTEGNCAPVSACFNDYYRLKENYIPSSSSTVTNPLYVRKTIKLLIHVMNPLGGPSSTPDNYFDVAGVDSLIYEVNTMLKNIPSAWSSGACPSCHVADTRFQVEVVKNTAGNPDIRFHNTGLLWKSIFGTTSTTHYSTYLAPYLDKENSVLNVFLMNNDLDSGRRGFATMLPGSYELHSGYNEETGYVVLSNLFKTPGSDRQNAAAIFIHELGHIMGLRHVFDNESYGFLETCNETDVDYLTDMYGTGSSKVCNTPFMTTNNMMDYGDWRFHLSPMQIGRWHRNAYFLACRRYVYNTEPEDINHDHTGEGQLYPLTINRDEIWDFDIKMYNDIVVKSGKKLTIKCRVYMPYHSNIIVEPGATLEIDNGLISAYEDTTMWYGISVLGNRNETQDAPFMHQGKIIMKNGAEIRHALCAVSLHDNINHDIMLDGGIAQIEDAVFTNNKHSIAWHSYHNLTWEYKGGVWTKTRLLPNRSFLRRTQFVVNSGMRRKPTHQVTMFDVDDIQIRGCSFQYSLPYGTYPDDDKNCAIRNVGSSINVDQYTYLPSGSTVPSTFKGFATGILIENFASTTLFRVVNSSFEDNQIGISAKAVNLFHVSNNTFKVNNPISIMGTSAGCFLYASANYKMYDNHFQRSSLTSFNRGQIGVLVREGGSYNQWVNNNSYQHLNTGNLAEGQNTNGIFDLTRDDYSLGLEFRCNNYIGNLDFAAQYCMGSNTINHGIRAVQGEFDKPAGNLFGSYDDIIQQYVSGSPSTRPINRYYYSTLDPLEQPDTYSPNVSPIGRPVFRQCSFGASIPDPGGSAGTTFVSHSPTAAAAARSLLMDAYQDYSEQRVQRISDALVAQKNPYAQTELAILQMQQGQIANGLGTYAAISSTMPLTVQEHNEFAHGAALIRMIAARYATACPRWDSLSPAEADTLRYLRDHTVAWARARACNWLSFALGENCSILLPDMAALGGGNGANLRRSPSDAIVGQEADYWSLSPNPASDYFEIQYQLAQEAQLRICDASGRTLFTTNLSAGQHKYRILASDWANGLYLYSLQQGTKTIRYGKLVKQ